MAKPGRLLTLGLLVSALVVTACSPEATRVRGGSAGADTNNRPASVDVHGQSNMYFQTPNLVPAVR